MIFHKCMFDRNLFNFSSECPIYNHSAFLYSFKETYLLSLTMKLYNKLIEQCKKPECYSP
ncbi:hypothetical protein Catovirus_1_163 [Catovirus CTV1]|uniref:Uncharacterized protein n=1 Tax=Catovirus CTV1 TaxID=1977631 RepID=A0A1V0S8T1_9VIRU|nr:hypothetical protein Catovirus_1_163 [Catovirus CTV1]